MQPSLTYIDAETGDLVERHALPASLHKHSIRNIDVAANDTVVIGCQFKRPQTQDVDLIGFHRRGSDIELLAQGPSVSQALRHYVGSVAVDKTGEIAAFTSSRGQQAVFFDVSSRKVIRIHGLPDVSGVAPVPHGNSFVLTGGGGDVAQIKARNKQLSTSRKVSWHWDSHAISVSMKQLHAALRLDGQDLLDPLGTRAFMVHNNVWSG